MKNPLRVVALALALIASPAIAVAACPARDGFEVLDTSPQVETAPKSKKVEVTRCSEGGVCIALRF